MLSLTQSIDTGYAGACSLIHWATGREASLISRSLEPQQAGLFNSQCFLALPWKRFGNIIASQAQDTPTLMEAFRLANMFIF